MKYLTQRIAPRTAEVEQEKKSPVTALAKVMQRKDLPGKITRRIARTEAKAYFKENYGATA